MFCDGSRNRAAAAAGVLAVAIIAVAVAAEPTPARYVTSAASPLVEQKLASAAPADPAAAGFQEVPHPGVRFLPNVARATNVPWIDSNGWRFQRGLRKAHYAKLPAGSAPLAAAEAFAYNVDAIFNPDPADVDDLGRMLRFLQEQEAPPLPARVNLGVVDDGSAQMGEILNLLTRRNLLYRVVKGPEPGLDRVVQLGTPDFPREAAKNPHEFAALVREKLGDDNRLVRVYGTTTVIAHFTGDSTRARLHLLSFAGRRRPQQQQQQAPNPQAVRVRLVGRYQPTRFAAFGADSKAELTDLRHVANTTEFWVPDFTTLAIVDLNPLTPAGGTNVLESAFTAQDVELAPDPTSPAWQKAPRVIADHDKSGAPIPGRPTEIRSLWTKENLYLLYICPFEALNLKPDPNAAAETPRLWNWDVAEAFIGSDFENIGRYKEFQVSPQSEWVDLDIDRSDPKRQEGMRWNSGYAVKARVDAQAKIWYGLMRIPFRAIDARTPEKGRELRIGLYRIAGVEPSRQYFAWRPTGQASFHYPQAFGVLRLR
jgi:hypothetical protein